MDNKMLRIIFICWAVIFIVAFLVLPKTDCQACVFEYEGESIDGYEAFALFEEACIDYRSPTAYFNLSELNLSDPS